MKPTILFIVSVLLLLSGPAQANLSIQSLQSSVGSLYTHDDRGILFTAVVEVSEENAPDYLTLFQTDKSGEKVKYRWKMTDDGFLGDKKADDLIYTRKVEFKKSKEGKYIFFISVDDAIKGPGQASAEALKKATSESPQVSVEVIRRPSFFELLGKIWDRLKNKE